MKFWVPNSLILSALDTELAHFVGFGYRARGTCSHFTSRAAPQHPGLWRLPSTISLFYQGRDSAISHLFLCNMYFNVSYAARDAKFPHLFLRKIYLNISYAARDAEMASGGIWPDLALPAAPLMSRAPQSMLSRGWHGMGTLLMQDS